MLFFDFFFSRQMGVFGIVNVIASFFFFFFFLGIKKLGFVLGENVVWSLI